MPERVFVIAEAGVNHNGSLDMAKELVRVAARAGADAVKFQTFSAEALASSSAQKAEYQRAATGEGGQLDMLRALQLDEDAHRALILACSREGVAFLSSPFDPASAALLAELGLPTIKLPSGAVTDLPLLRAVGRLGRKVIVSTGMADLDEVRAALDALAAAGTRREDVTLLQCTTAYPAPPEEANLLAMVTMRRELDVAVGYSDHTLTLSVPLAAVALGASVIEKHITLDRTLPGPDHAASMEPAEFAELVSGIREVTAALGDGVKRPSPAELANRDAVRTSIVAARAIAAGAVIGEDDIAAKRPGTGVSPMRWDEVVGSRALRGFEPDEQIEVEP